jgi:hypothetical protein
MLARVLAMGAESWKTGKSGQWVIVMMGKWVSGFGAVELPRRFSPG